MSETERILQEVRDHAAYWHSDMAKRLTVEKHLAQKGIIDVETKVNELIKTGKLTLIPKPRGDYLKEPESFEQLLEKTPHLKQCANCGHTWKARAQRPGSKERQQRCGKCGSRSVT
jgi:DNA-directed RNA polymerase subunit RPC12/RpoP